MRLSAQAPTLPSNLLGVLVASLLSVPLLGTGGDSANAIIRLENDRLRLDFSRDNGSLLQITNLANGEKFIHEPGYSRLVKLIQFTPEKSSNVLLSHEAGRPEMKIYEDVLKIGFPPLLDDGEVTGVVLTVTVRLPEGSQEAYFTIEIENGSEHPLVEVWFPFIAGREGQPGVSGDVFTTSRGRERNLYGRFDHGMFNTHAFGRHGQRIGISPGSLLPMMDLSTPEGGLSYIKYERKTRPTDFVYVNLSQELTTVQLGWAWVTTILLKPGDTYRSSEFGVGVHESDWHATADRLRGFISSWWKPPPRAQSLKEKIGLFHVQIKGFNGEPFHDFDELPAIARDCLHYNISDLMFWDYTASVYSRPDAEADYWEMPAPRMAMLKESLKEVKAMGFQVSACMNYRLVIETSRAWQRIGSEAQYSFFGRPLYGNPAGSMNGAIYLNRYYEQGTRSLCQGTERFREFALELTKQTLDIGLNSIFIDQTSESSYALPKGRSDLDPFEVMGRAYQWYGEAADLARSRDPDSYSLGQKPDLWNTGGIDAFFNWDWERYYLAEVFLYVMPDLCIIWPTDENQRSRLSKAFAYGAFLAVATRDMTGLLSDEPEFANHVARLGELRRRTVDYVARGRFVDERGLRVSGGVGKAFLSEQGAAVTLANSKKEVAYVDLELDSAKLPELSFAESLILLEGEEVVKAEPTEVGGVWNYQITLPPYAAAVLTIPSN